jgi:hypothetical protein
MPARSTAGPIGSVADKSKTGLSSSSAFNAGDCGNTRSRSLSSSRHYSELDVMPSDSMPTLEAETHFSSRDAVQLELFC